MFLHGSLLYHFSTMLSTQKCFHKKHTMKKDTPDGVSFGEMVGLQGLEPGTVRL